MIFFCDLEKSSRETLVHTLVEELSDWAVKKILMNLGGLEEDVAEKVVEEGTWANENRWRSADERYEIEMRNDKE